MPFKTTQRRQDTDHTYCVFNKHEAQYSCKTTTRYTQPSDPIMIPSLQHFCASPYSTSIPSMYHSTLGKHPGSYFDMVNGEHLGIQMQKASAPPTSIHHGNCPVHWVSTQVHKNWELRKSAHGWLPSSWCWNTHWVGEVAKDKANWCMTLGKKLGSHCDNRQNFHTLDDHSWQNMYY